MSIIRTSLSLIGFGFTIYQVFQKAQEAKILGLGHEPRNFGVALVLLGTLLLTFGLIYHVRFMRELRSERAQMVAQGLLHGDSAYPISITLIAAALLWVLGLLVIAGITFNVGSFG